MYKPWLHDICGWELPAFCFVEWHKVSNPEPVVGLPKRGTIQRVNTSTIDKFTEQWLDNKPEAWQAEPNAQQVKDEEILDFLCQEGLNPQSKQNLKSAFLKIQELIKYYYESRWADVREHEIRTFLIIPLLLALGWPEKNVKIELPMKQGNKRGKIDIACFPRPYRKDGDKDCILIIESKHFGSGLNYANNQAERYAVNFPKCKEIVVSNGLWYKIYPSKVGTSEPSASLNLYNLRDPDPVYPQEIGGCYAALRSLLPPKDVER
jgi:hypothetical protein